MSSKDLFCIKLPPMPDSCMMQKQTNLWERKEFKAIHKHPLATCFKFFKSFLSKAWLHSCKSLLKPNGFNRMFHEWLPQRLSRHTDTGSPPASWLWKRRGENYDFYSFHEKVLSATQKNFSQGGRRLGIKGCVFVKFAIRRKHGRWQNAPHFISLTLF